MRTYVLKRLLLVPVTMLGITLITFMIMHLAPGDPAAMKVQPGVGGEQSSDRGVSREVYEKTRARFDLDKPLLMQYLRWLGKLAGVRVDVDGAKAGYKQEIAELLLAGFEQEQPDRIKTERAKIERRVEAKQDWTDPAAQLAEVERQLASWKKAQSEERSFKYADEINQIRQRYVDEYGETFEDVFWYVGVSLNRTDGGSWYPLDFGQAIRDDREVWETLAEKLPVSIELSLLSIFLAYIVAIPLGIHSSVYKDSLSDALITTTLFILYSLPSFWVAIMLLLFTSKGGLFLKLFPVKGLHGDLPANASSLAWLWDHIQHLILPVTCLTYASFAYISRQMRAGMLEVIRQDYIRTARAKGLDEKVVIFKHALRNSLIPIITIVAFILPSLVGGSVIIETIFQIDGIGKLSFEAILNRDYPILMAVFALSAFLTLIGILLSDLLYAVVNPTISFEGK